MYRQSQLSCFAGSLFALMGRHLGELAMTTAGLELTESCAETFLATTSGLGPQEWRYRDQRGQGSIKNQKAYERNGFEATSRGYYHGPEVIESIFYAWRVTGDQMWRDIAWTIFRSLSEVLETGSGWASLSDVNARPSSGEGQGRWAAAWENEQGSFLYAEVFKYLYLTFTAPSYYSLDEWVFNTEAHPLRRHDAGQPKIQADSKAGGPL